MNACFLGKPPANIEQWLKSHQPTPPTPPTPTKEGVWIDLESHTRFKYYSEDSSARYWDITSTPGQTYLMYEIGKGWTYQYLTVKSDVVVGDGSQKELDFNFTGANPRSCKWYAAEADIPTWMLRGNWKLDDVVRTTAINDNNDYTLWGNDNYHVKWDKINKKWSGKRNGKTMNIIDETSESTKTFSYTTSSGSFTAVWYAS